ncbi:hypothetical protein [Novosphingobium pentaromativorans]|uniref:hypothetical protein n=1 Tax=Novosphingobium pentaromativorans TaxID=205844 RepID=UPI001EE66BEB|nr:hypothetical protein [Novosphingobium pentaromativorans]
MLFNGLYALDTGISLAEGVALVAPDFRQFAIVVDFDPHTAIAIADATEGLFFPHGLALSSFPGVQSVSLRQGPSHNTPILQEGKDYFL